VTGESRGQVSFQAHAELLQAFLAERKAIVARIESLLNARRKPLQYLQDRTLLARDFEDCFFAQSTISADQSRLRGQLEEARQASAFKPCQMAELFNDLVHPAEMMIRGFHCWQQTRWPGRNGRVRYAETLFNVYLLRCLELLSLRLWDAGAGGAGDRLAQLQRVLDQLWDGAPADQPVLVRDARWLITLAQSPTTDELGDYFEIAQQVAQTLTRADRIEAQRAAVVMIGGHLRSQIRHYCMNDGVSINDDSVVRRTRSSNALDFALLIQGLVPLLEGYEHALYSGNEPNRLELASAVLQGVSPDPEMFLNRIDLLGAYSMIEHLFIAADNNGEAAYTPLGRRHVRLLQQYEALIGRAAKALHEDCRRFEPADGTYSPYGAIYGTASNLTELMAFKTLQPDADSRFGLEDVFVDGDVDSGKVAWVDGWRKLPHIDRKVQRLYDYPQQFAEDIFERIAESLGRCAFDGEADDRFRTGHLVLAAADEQQVDATLAGIPDLPTRYVVSSDPEIVAAGNAEARDQARLLRDRQEGYFVVSFETSGGWVAVSKDMLTEVLGAKRDAKIVGLPPAAETVLKLMGRNLVAPDLAGQAGAQSPKLNA
jgi:hypothetical protein